MDNNQQLDGIFIILSVAHSWYGL